jgi:hypothetical protein
MVPRVRPAALERRTHRCGYETKAGINHRELARIDPDHHDPLVAWLGQCEVIGGGDADVLHSLW